MVSESSDWEIKAREEWEYQLANYHCIQDVAACIRRRPYRSCLTSVPTTLTACRIRSILGGDMKESVARSMTTSSTSLCHRLKSAGLTYSCNGKTSQKVMLPASCLAIEASFARSMMTCKGPLQ